jgi:hypothetical protein
MSEDIKKITSALSDKTLVNEEKVQRPNIDLLIKRIMQERRQERKNNITTIFSIFVGVAFISYLFSQG